MSKLQGKAGGLIYFGGKAGRFAYSPLRDLWCFTFIPGFWQMVSRLFEIAHDPGKAFKKI